MDLKTILDDDLEFTRELVCLISQSLSKALRGFVSPEVVDDLAQESLRIALSPNSKFDHRFASTPKESARLWVLGIARIVRLNYLRRRSKTARVEFGLQIDSDNCKVSSHHNPLEQIQNQESVDQLLTALDTLPPAQRHAVIEWYLQEFTGIEDALSESKHSAVLRYRALNTLKQRVPLQKPADTRTRQRHTIVLIDDENETLTDLSRWSSSMATTVIAYSAGELFLQDLEREPGRFGEDLCVVSDYLLHPTRGDQVIRRAKQVRPIPRSLLITRATARDMKELQSRSAVCGSTLLQKPFTLNQFALAVHSN